MTLWNSSCMYLFSVTSIIGTYCLFPQTLCTPLRCLACVSSTYMLYYIMCSPVSKKKTHRPHCKKKTLHYVHVWLSLWHISTVALWLTVYWLTILVGGGGLPILKTIPSIMFMVLNCDLQTHTHSLWFIVSSHWVANFIFSRKPVTNLHEPLGLHSVWFRRPKCLFNSCLSLHKWCNID